MSLHPRSASLHPEVIEHKLPFRAPAGYVVAAAFLRRLVRRINPDLINAHYATGYGVLARLCGIKPLLLSVWGSDVYAFPYKNAFNRWVLGGNLRVATAVASTSRAMAEQVRRLVPEKAIFVTPFGIDEQLFVPLPAEAGVQAPSATIVVGTVKGLSHEYGIDTLLRAFAILHDRYRGLSHDPGARLILRVYGGGPQREQLVELARTLSISKKVEFMGRIPHEAVPSKLQQMDVYVALSRSESFGVAILEASACGRPVLVSNAEGLAEVTVQGETGFVVPKEDPEAAAEKLDLLIRDPLLREEMGRAGRRHVLEHYTWSKSLDLMMQAYTGTIALHKQG